MSDLKPFTVQYSETTGYSVSVLARSGEDAEEIADYVIQSYGFDHPAVSRSDIVDCEVSYVKEGLEDSQHPYDPSEDEEYEY